jgi:uncharacterized protein YaaR (DUF327 family)
MGDFEVMNILQKLEDELYPFWTQRVNDLIEKDLSCNVSRGSLNFFIDCWSKFKSVWYIHKRIKEFDSKYTKLGEALLKLPEDRIKKLPYVQNIGKHEYRYEAYWETVELEHLFFQAKACADIFAKAAGSVFEKSAPKNIPKLIKILQKVKDSGKKDKARKILEEIERNKRYLRGVILPPEQLNRHQKSLRDISTHYERLDVWFKIRLPEGDGDPGVYGGFIDTRGVRLQNFKAVNISQSLWFGLKKIIENSFAILSKN